MAGFFSWRGLKQSAIEVHSFSAGMQRRDAFHFVFKRRYRYTVRSHMLGERHKRMFLSDLRFFCSCCRTSCVSVQPCTPKVLPNTETFLHSRVFFVTCVVPALCQIMYSLSVCSDGTTSAAPRSFRQNRPPARTLSLTRFAATRLAVAARRELALQIEVDVARHHMIALRINLMNISAVTIFLARVVNNYYIYLCVAGGGGVSQEILQPGNFAAAA